jgi:hypothetical protein
LISPDSTGGTPVAVKTDGGFDAALVSEVDDVDLDGKTARIRPGFARAIDVLLVGRPEQEIMLHNFAWEKIANGDVDRTDTIVVFA